MNNIADEVDIFLYLLAQTVVIPSDPKMIIAGNWQCY